MLLTVSLTLDHLSPDFLSCEKVKCFYCLSHSWFGRLLVVLQSISENGEGQGYTSLSLFTTLLFLLSVTCSRLHSKNVGWKIPEINNS